MMQQTQVVNEALFHRCEVKASVSLLVDSRKKSMALNKIDEAELWLLSLKEDLRDADEED